MLDRLSCQNEPLVRPSAKLRSFSHPDGQGHIVFMANWRVVACPEPTALNHRERDCVTATASRCTIGYPHCGEAVGIFCSRHDDGVGANLLVEHCE